MVYSLHVMWASVDVAGPMRVRLNRIDGPSRRAQGTRPSALETIRWIVFCLCRPVWDRKALLRDALEHLGRGLDSARRLLQ